MKIDNRKVNGQITIDRRDIINPWTILVSGMTAMWIAGIDKNNEPITIPASVAGNYIETTIASFNPLQYLVILHTGADFKLLPNPAYSYKPGKISIDIGEILSGATLEIALPSGAITLEEPI